MAQKKVVKKGNLSFIKRAYTADYILKNPSSNAKLRQVWQAAVIEYLFREGVDLSDKKNYYKPIQGIEFAGIVSIYNTLAGKTKVPAKKVALKKATPKRKAK